MVYKKYFSLALLSIFTSILLVYFSPFLQILLNKEPTREWTSNLTKALENKHHGQWFFDRQGQFLSVVNKEKKDILFSTSLNQVNPFFTKSLLCLEDQGFYSHYGVPIEGIMRALWYNLRARRVRAGGSGITQQVIKMFRGRAKGLKSKLAEARYALWLDANHTKEDILTTYINRAQFGNRQIGIWQASWYYFGISPTQLSVAQAAYLASLPYAPSRLSPLKSVQTAIPRQQRALKCLHKKGILTHLQFTKALQEPITIKKYKPIKIATHLTESLAYDRLSKDLKRFDDDIKIQSQQKLTLTIDSELQQRAESIVHHYVQRQDRQGLQQVAVVGLSIATGDVLFWVGSRGYDDPNAGQVDHVLGLRLPGSTLKPFLYGLAIDRGFELDSVLPDKSLYFKTPRGQYHPENYDHQYRGDIPLMSALAMSLNVPSVWLLNQCGVNEFLSVLRGAGLNTLNQDALHYGLGLSLGDGEVRLIDLANAYRGLVLNGYHLPWKVIKDMDDSHGEVQHGHRAMVPFMSARAAQAILHVLSNRQLRSPAFGEDSALALPFPAAVKTGTSQGYSNAWTIGVTPTVAIGVWIKPYFGAQRSGGRIAAPLWRELMLMANQHQDSPSFDSSALSKHDRFLLSQLVTRERSEYLHQFQHNELNDPMIKRLEDFDSIQESSSSSNPNEKDIKIHIIRPPQGGTYQYMHQRASFDNQLKAEARVVSAGDIFEKNRQDYKIEWLLNNQVLFTPKKTDLIVWFDPWSEKETHRKEPKKEQQLCLKLLKVSSKQQLLKNCVKFQTIY